jgi:hypothetical protein
LPVLDRAGGIRILAPPMKILVRVVLGLVVLLVVALVAVIVFVDPLIEEAVERGATYGTGVETTLGGVDAGLLSGELGLDELSVANPAGFRPEPFLAMKSGRAKWDNRSLVSDTIEIEELVFDGVTLNLERTDGKTNYGVILDNLGKLSSKDDAPAEDGPKKTIKIGLIEIKNIKAGVHMSGVPLADGLSVDIPRITIEDFDSSGDMDEVVAKVTRAVLDAILAAVLEAGANILPTDLLKDLGGEVADLGKAIGKEAGAVLKDVGKGVEKSVGEVLKGAEGLFNPKK